MMHVRVHEKSREKKRGGGVGILINSDLHYTVRKDLQIQKQHLEAVGLEVKMKGKSITIMSMYRPPNTNEKAFLTDLQSIMGKIKSETRKNSIIGLDHNLDLLKIDKHRGTEKFLDMMINHNHLACITRPTRITKDTATLIDNIMISNELHGSHNCGIIETDISDHLPCIAIFPNLLAAKRSPKVITSRNLNEQACKLIEDDIKNRNWHELVTKENVNGMFDHFHDFLIESIDKHAPEKTFVISPKKVISEPWMSKGLLKCKKKNKCNCIGKH